MRDDGSSQRDKPTEDAQKDRFAMVEYSGHFRGKTNAHEPEIMSVNEIV